MYVVVFLSILFLLLMNSIINFYNIITAKKKIKEDTLSEYIKLKALQVEHKYVTMELADKFKKFPYIFKYVQNISRLLDEGGEKFENVCPTPIGSDKEFVHGLIQDLNRVSVCQQDVKNIFWESAKLADLVYQLKHPIKYRFNQTKKNMLLRILDYLIKIMENQLNRKPNKKKLYDDQLEVRLSNENQVEIKNDAALSPA